MSSEEHVGQQFRMHTNIKSDAGSQGTLFQGGYPTNWHRGYSPERKDEVIGATIHSGLDPQKQHASRAAETAAILDTVARSTVPTDHLKKLGWYSSSTVTEAKGTQGTYNYVPDRSSARIAPGGGRGLTPIHEIGHHVSRLTSQPHAVYTTPKQRGTEEGFAENYAETHFRDRRGNQVRSEATARGWATRPYEMTHGNPREFADAFNAKRKQSPLAPKEPSLSEIIDAQDRERLPKEHVKGQIPLLDKVGTEGRPNPRTGARETSWHWAHPRKD